MTWPAEQHSRFEDERTRPVRDLVRAIPREHAATAVDLGCGPGNSTEVLAGRYGSAQIVGIDNSEEMLAKCREKMLARATQRSCELLRADLNHGIEIDNALDIRVHTIHDRSRRFDASVMICRNCHVTEPTGPARGVASEP